MTPQDLVSAEECAEGASMNGLKAERAEKSTAVFDGAENVSGFRLPPSSLLDEKSLNLISKWEELNDRLRKELPGHWFDPSAISAVRDYYDKRFYAALIGRLKALYNVRIETKDIAGVPAEVYTPAEGVPARNQARVLINLHGGGFLVGARTVTRIESIPIAAIGKIKVIGIDYRKAPEWRFPAATDDVVAVYREIVTQYAPKHIGIYGCSAGAVLTAQTIARLQKECLPLPGAVGMLCGAASYWAHGDSTHVAARALYGHIDGFNEHPYFRNADPRDPLVQPIRSDEVMGRFPPSLLLASTRDLALSSVAHTHSRLVALGIEAQLHVWEGLDHAFQYNPDLPQSREVHEVTAKFFERHLGS